MTTEVRESALDTWAIVEMFGHKKLAGKVSEHVIGSAALIRVDVPEILAPRPGGVDGEQVTKPPYTKLVGTGSIYCITPCTEEVARLAAAQLERYNDPIPVSLPAARQIAAGPTSDAEVVDAGDDESEFSGHEDDDGEDMPL